MGITVAHIMQGLLMPGAGCEVKLCQCFGLEAVATCGVCVCETCEQGEPVQSLVQ
jgi:hypothetical protein